MPESIDEYVSILISKNTYNRLQDLSELIVPITTDTCDAVIGAMLIKLDCLKEGDKVLALDLKSNVLEVYDVTEPTAKPKPKKKEAARK